MSHAVRLLALALITLGGCSEYELRAPTDPVDVPAAEDPIAAVGDAEVPPGVGGVEGRICAPDGETWVSGADVWVELDDGTRVSATTDGEGHFVLEGLPPGTVTVYVQKGSFSTEFDVLIVADEITALAYEECLPGDEISIAVVTGEYDSIQVVLDRLNVQYTLIDGRGIDAHVSLLRDPGQLEQYDIIFFNCGMNDAWLPYRAQIAANIRDYVRNGGSVYTSDWSYYLAEAAYPDMLEFKGDDARPGSAQLGVAGDVRGVVLDADMLATLGNDQADLWYDLDIWITPESVGAGTNELIRGTYPYYDLTSYDYATAIGTGPLAARRYDGEGQILFTTFHNERQSTFDMDRLLQEIILSL